MVTKSIFYTFFFFFSRCHLIYNSLQHLIQFEINLWTIFGTTSKQEKVTYRACLKTNLVLLCWAAWIQPMRLSLQHMFFSPSIILAILSCISFQFSLSILNCKAIYKWKGFKSGKHFFFLIFPFCKMNERRMQNECFTKKYQFESSQQGFKIFHSQSLNITAEDCRLLNNFLYLFFFFKQKNILP